MPLCLIACFHGGAPSGRQSRRCLHYPGGAPPAQTASGLVARLAPGFRPPELAPPARVNRSNGHFSRGTPPRSPPSTARYARAGRRPAPPSKRNPSPPTTPLRGADAPRRPGAATAPPSRQENKQKLKKLNNQNNAYKTRLTKRHKKQTNTCQNVNYPTPFPTIPRHAPHLLPTVENFTFAIPSRHPLGT